MLLLAAALAVVPPTPDWMGELYAQRPDTKLTQIVIPGPTIPERSRSTPKARANSPRSRALTRRRPEQSETNPCGAGRLAKAQSKNFTGQLNGGGIRYLDMRLGVPDNKVVTAKKARQEAHQKAAAKVPIHLQHTFILGSADRRTPSRSSGSRSPPPRTSHPRTSSTSSLTGKKKIDRAITSAIDKILRTYKVDGSSVCSRAWSSNKVADVTQATSDAWAADRNLVVLYAKGELPQKSCYRPARGAVLLAEHRRSGEVRDRQPGVLDEPAVCAGRPDQPCGRRR